MSNGEMTSSVSMSITMFKIRNFSSNYTLISLTNKKTIIHKQNRTKIPCYKMKEPIIWTYRTKKKMK